MDVSTVNSLDVLIFAGIVGLIWLTAYAQIRTKRAERAERRPGYLDIPIVECDEIAPDTIVVVSNRKHAGTITNIDAA